MLMMSGGPIVEQFDVIKERLEQIEAEEAAAEAKRHAAQQMAGHGEPLAESSAGPGWLMPRMFPPSQSG